MARVLGQSLARVAEASRFLIGQPSSAGLDGVRRRTAGQVARPLTDMMEPPWPTSSACSWWSSSGTRWPTARDIGAGQRDMAVCFADLVGWTELSEEAEEEQRSAASPTGWRDDDRPLRPPVRVVKMIGDAAMFVSSETGRCSIWRSTWSMPPEGRRVPAAARRLVSGHAISRWGDWYGRPVNLRAACARARGPAASRHRAGEEACDDDGYRFSAAGEKHLKGIGAVPLWRARRDGAA